MRDLEQQVFDRRCEAAKQGFEKSVRFYDELLQTLDFEIEDADAEAEEIKELENELQKKDERIDELREQIKDLEKKLDKIAEIL